MSIQFQIAQFSSLEKLMPGHDPAFSDCKALTALRGEVVSWQIAIKCDNRLLANIVVGGEIADLIHIREVSEVSVPAMPDLEDWVGAALVDDKPGAYPDVLNELAIENQVICGKSWRTLWLDAVIPQDCRPGDYSLSVSFFQVGTNEFLGDCTMTVAVKDAVLPPQTLKCTNWLHTDCLAQYYNVPVFSEEYWRIVENFMSWAVKHGINMILTPVFTPPLDTEEGRERLTVQLVDVYCTESGYSFDFANLRRWVDIARKVGVQYFEICHMFTQWGARFAPKVMAQTTDGGMRRIFGWDTPANSGKYPEFLRIFLPELRRELNNLGILDHTYFHCSDEPREEHLQWYSADMALLKELLPGCHIIDALSNPRFTAEGVVTLPVPEIDDYHAFDQFDLPERWCYYCCGPRGKYVNRFIFLQSVHNRMLGALLFKFNCQGFLHWGLNFYNAFHSLYPINPFVDTTAGKVYPGGDAFIVYPGQDGTPISSLRGEIFYHALQDQRAFEAIAEKVGRDKVLNCLEMLADNGNFDFGSFVHNAERFLKVRNNILNLL